MFWFIFPIGHEQGRVHGWPYATFALIFINLAVFFATLGPMWDSVDVQLSARQAKRQLLCEDFLATERAKPNAPSWPPLNAEYCQTHYDEFRQFATDFIAGKVVPADDPMFTDYQKLVDTWQAKIDRGFDRRYGLVPKHFNPLSAITAMFLHASLGHVVGNMIFLYLAGGILEDTFGVVAYLLLYFIAGFFGNVLFALMNAGSNVPIIGASGAVFGLIGAFLPRFAKAKIQFFYFYWIIIRWGKGYFTLPAYIVLPFYFLENLVPALLGAEHTTNIAYWAHVGGFCTGLGLYFVLRYFHPPEETVEEEEEEELEDTSAIGRAKRRAERRLKGDPEATDFFGRFRKIQTNVAEHNVIVAKQDAARLANELVEARDLPLLGDLARFFVDVPGEPPIPDRAYALLGPYFAESEMPELALQMYETLLRHYPTSPLAPKALFQSAHLLATASHNAPAARERLRQLIARFPMHPAAAEAQHVLTAAGQTGALRF